MASADIERVERWLDGGELLHPFQGDAPPSTVDLARAVANIGGVPLADSDDHAALLVEQIGDERPLLLVLVDGLGCVFHEHTRPDGFLASAEHVQLRAVFPSTTAAALTTFATGAWPSQHGVPAWNTHLHDRDLTATILPYVERLSNRSLREFGIRPNEAFAFPSRLASITEGLRTYHPRQIADSEFTSYGRGDWPTDPYDHLQDAVRSVVRRVVELSEPGVHYLYLPMVDAAAHRDGPFGPDTLRALEAVDDALTALRDQFDGQARIAVTPDHGELHINEGDKSVILPDDYLLEDLHTPPHGETRVPMFCVRRERAAQFEASFRQRWGRDWALLRRSDCEELQLFGPGDLSDRSANRIGTHIAISAKPKIITYGEAGNPQDRLIGHHAGLRPEEMEIPLLLA